MNIVNSYLEYNNKKQYAKYGFVDISMASNLVQSISYVGNIKPTNPVIGEMCYDFNTNTMQIYTGTDWQILRVEALNDRANIIRSDSERGLRSEFIRRAIGGEI